MTDPLVDGLSEALRCTREVVAGVRDDQWDLPTPCSEWSVADLTEHLIGGNRLFATAFSGAPARPAVEDPDFGQGRALTGYDEAATELTTAFAAEGALDRIVQVPFGTVPGRVAFHLRMTELLVHGWDLAQATGQPFAVPEALAAQELAFSRQALQQIPPDRSPFGSAQPSRPDAGPLEQLVSLLGRTVGS